MYMMVHGCVDGARFSDPRARRRRSDGVAHYCNGCASTAFEWCRRDAIDVMALVDAKGLEVADADAPNEPKHCLYFKYPCNFLRLQRRNGRRPDGLERLARLPQLVALRLDEVVRLLRVLVEGLLDLIEFALLRLRFSLSSIDVLL